MSIGFILLVILFLFLCCCTRGQTLLCFWWGRIFFFKGVYLKEAIFCFTFERNYIDVIFYSCNHCDNEVCGIITPLQHLPIILMVWFGRGVGWNKIFGVWPGDVNVDAHICIFFSSSFFFLSCFCLCIIHGAVLYFLFIFQLWICSEEMGVGAAP